MNYFPLAFLSFPSDTHTEMKKKKLPKYSSHYDYLDACLPDFFRKLNIGKPLGIVSAHGDKFYSYRDEFEENGIPFAQGVAIGLLTYMAPYSQEVRETENGWIDVKDWIIANKDKFLPLLPPVE